MTTTRIAPVAAADVVATLDRMGVRRQRLTLDSRSIAPGDVFIAVPGARVDGRAFIAAALHAGAAAVVQEAAAATTHADDPRVIPVTGLAGALGSIASVFYDQPARAMRVYGVTGTNGKTSITHWLMQACNQRGMRCASVGTLGVSLGAQSWPTSNTTPDAAHLQTILRDVRDAGATAVAMEVSSHALELARVQGMRFDTVVFTNLTQDHLDFHGTMAAYGAAKAKLFTDYPATHRIINADDDFGRALVAKDLPGTISCGLEHGDVRGHIAAMNADGMRLSIRYRGACVEVSTALIGRFNASNLLAVAAALIAEGVAVQALPPLLSALTPAPGRMQRVAVDAAGGPQVFVDYAHTPDALAKALQTVRETGPDAMTVVFGCGGNRDRSKRAQMGRIAAEQADHIVVTSDNPRDEDAAAIIDDILRGVPPASLTRTIALPRRDEAIRYAIAHAAGRDAVLIAGKGHEDYQEISGVRHAFSDVAHARAALLARQRVNGGAHVVG